MVGDRVEVPEDVSVRAEVGVLEGLDVKVAVLPVAMGPITGGVGVGVWVMSCGGPGADQKSPGTSAMDGGLSAFSAKATKSWTAASMIWACTG